MNPLLKQTNIPDLPPDRLGEVQAFDKRARRPFFKRKRIVDLLLQVLISFFAFIWLIPIIWVVLTSLRAERGAFTSYFFPKGYTLKNYIELLTNTSTFYFGRWFINTLFVAICSAVLSTFFVISIAYVMSRMRFRLRKPLLNVALILGMFPGFMAMIAVYYVLKGVGLTQSLLSLILVYSAGSATGFYVAKGFFDTTPRALDEAAMLDGATRAQIFWNISLPLSKPIIVYTVLTTFLAPWMDYIFVSIIMGDNYANFTVALGLFKMLERERITRYFTQFAAGAVIVSIPITALFLLLQRYFVEGITSGAVKS